MCEVMWGFYQLIVLSDNRVSDGHTVSCLIQCQKIASVQGHREIWFSFRNTGLKKQITFHQFGFARKHEKQTQAIKAFPLAVHRLIVFQWSDVLNPDRTTYQFSNQSFPRAGSDPQPPNTRYVCTHHGEVVDFRPENDSFHWGRTASWPALVETEASLHWDWSGTRSLGFWGFSSYFPCSHLVIFWIKKEASVPGMYLETLISIWDKSSQICFSDYSSIKGGYQMCLTYQISLLQPQSKTGSVFLQCWCAQNTQMINQRL